MYAKAIFLDLNKSNNLNPNQIIIDHISIES